MHACSATENQRALFCAAVTAIHSSEVLTTDELLLRIQYEKRHVRKTVRRHVCKYVFNMYVDIYVSMYLDMSVRMCVDTSVDGCVECM